MQALILALLLLFASCLPALADPESTDSLLQRAEERYSCGSFSQALPLYEQASMLSDKPGTDPGTRTKIIRYLADCALKSGNIDVALKNFQRLSELATDTDNSVVSLNGQCACYAIQGDIAKAQSLAAESLRLAKKNAPGSMLCLQTEAEAAYLNYLNANYKAAVVELERSYSGIDTLQAPPMIAWLTKQKIAYATAGGYYHLQDWPKSLYWFERVYDADCKLFGSQDLQTGWALLALSDVLQRMGRKDESSTNYSRAIWIFRKVNRDRILAECLAQPSAGQDATAVASKVDRGLFGESAGSIQPANDQPLCHSSIEALANHDVCSGFVRPFDDAPGHCWFDPNVPQKGLIIAIHGLSLDHSSYDALARKLAGIGYSTVAFDLRGFGTYRQALGAETVDFEGCLQDLKSVISALRKDYPTMPLFLVGESMGGAIAVQFAAQNPNLIDGLVSSVPAGKRYKDRRTALKVAVKFIENKDRPFDIGRDVIEQATSDPKVKEHWESDPSTRMSLSPSELMRFQQMMNRNIHFARQLDQVPVLVFQGVGDKLVKPQATYDLFQAISSHDKNLMLVGNAEHLLLEEGCFSPTVFNSLVAWMDAHADSRERNLRSTSLPVAPH